MGRLIDIHGQKFERLTVIGLSDFRRVKHPTVRFWRCVCDCGKEVFANYSDMKDGKQKSCGCLRRETAARNVQKNNRVKHGETFGRKPTKEYMAWADMKGRCNNKRHASFHNYGARGITVCGKWGNDFSAFLEDMGRAPKGMTLERKDVNLGYSPENCCWASLDQQASNKRNSRIVNVFGEQLTLTAAARKYGAVKGEAYRIRIAKGWDPEKALLTPPIRKGRCSVPSKPF